MKIFSSKKYKNFHLIVLKDDRMNASRISNVLVTTKMSLYSLKPHSKEIVLNRKLVSSKESIFGL